MLNQFTESFLRGQRTEAASLKTIFLIYAIYLFSLHQWSQNKQNYPFRKLLHVTIMQLLVPLIIKDTLIRLNRIQKKQLMYTSQQDMLGRQR